MYAVPTTTVSILGGPETTNAMEDLVSGDTVTASGVPCSLLEQTRRVFVKADQRAQTVTFYTARLPGDTVVSATSRIMDEATGAVYYVDSVAQVQSPTQLNDVRCDLRKTA